MTASQILLQAKELIREPSQWIKGDFHRELDDGSVSYCLVGAVYEAASMLEAEHQEDDEAGWTLKRVVQDRTGRGSPIFWNDSPGTQHQDVLDMLDHAIAAALEKENR